MSALCMYAHSKTIARLTRKLRQRNLCELERAIIETELIRTESRLRAEIRGWQERQQARDRSD